VWPVPKQLSQRSLVAVTRALREYVYPHHELERGPDVGELLYENDFPHWFVTHARSEYGLDWGQILPAVRNTQFFFPHTYFGGPGTNITDEPYLSKEDAVKLGEYLLQRLAALVATLPEGEQVARSLELDGFQPDRQNLRLISSAAVTSDRQEEERVTSLVQQSGLQNSAIILQHLRDARDLFLQQKDHPSIGEARNLVQSLIDGIGDETNAHGRHALGYPSGTKNRWEYLRDVGFLTLDEMTAVGAAWGFLSSGNHPGIPSRDEARIALILTLEFGVMLLLKFVNWKANGFQRFS
jgi:hypothetical protein